MSGKDGISKKKTETCRVCGSSGPEALPHPVEAYWRCADCGCVFLDSSSFLSPESEWLRYQKHENSLEDPGYKSYLEHFIDEILVSDNLNADEVNRVFDFGSGPVPALVTLLRRRGFDAAGWDPFFNPEGRFFDGGADLVTCLEVAEHFHEPREGFAALAEAARVNGWVAVATHPVSSVKETLERDFPAWWYRQDPTHVVFYSREGLILAAERAGLRYLGQCGSHTFLFRREAVE